MSTRLFAGESFAIFPFGHQTKSEDEDTDFGMISVAGQAADGAFSHGRRRPGLRLARPGRTERARGGGAAHTMARPVAAPGRRPRLRPRARAARC